MQHSLHDDRPRFSAASDEDQRSEFPSHTMTASWAAATTTCSGSVDNCMHTGSASTTQGPGSIFRPLFSDPAVVEAAGHGYVEELLQLQLPPAASAVETSFDVLSSSDVYETYTSSHCSDGDFAAAPTFSVEGFLSTSGGSASESPAKQNVPHTLEFVSPPAPRGSFHGMSSKKSRLPDAVAAPVPVLASPVENIHYAKGSDGLHSKDNSVNGDEDQQHSMSQIAASSCKKARLQTFEQCNRAANDPSQFQAIMNKVQSARSKEKLGERINALQQLVSPFGKTDTASVLSEAIGYIKFLQEQVQVLSSPYMKPSSTLNRQDGGKEIISDLRSRGLCLVPVSCTINVANNNNFNIGADYWASTPSVGSNTPSTRLSASS